VTPTGQPGRLSPWPLVATLLLALSPAHRAHAEAVTYAPVALADQPPGVHIDLPYTFGTHQFDVRDVRGAVRVDWDQGHAVSGRLTVALTALGGDGDTLHCHMRESLGLDYSKSSFPGAHVCDGGKLPAAGKDAVAFPEIAFEIVSAKWAGAGAAGTPPLAAGQSARLAASGRWTIHGVRRDDTLDLKLTAVQADATGPRMVRIEGSRKIRLADYGIQVKRALVITAGEEATVKFNLLVKAQAPQPPKP